jgi:predicted DNA-binding transcriptional regulator AlpA
MQNNSPDRLLSRGEVEAEFGLSRCFLELSAWCGDGPPMIRIGRRAVRYRRGDILAWIDARRIEPEPLSGGNGLPAWNFIICQPRCPRLGRC